jgi:hypothetical protein
MCTNAAFLLPEIIYLIQFYESFIHARITETVYLYIYQFTDAGH